jgi:hypothetical protein
VLALFDRVIAASWLALGTPVLLNSGRGPLLPSWLYPFAWLQPVSDLLNGVPEGVPADLLLELVFERFVQIVPSAGAGLIRTESGSRLVE